MTDDWSEFRPNLNVFGVTSADPGWLYLMRAGELFKIGKTKNPKRRIRDALTWSPDIEVIAMKPFWNIGVLERMTHEGLSDCWHKGEWFKFIDDDMRDFMVDGLCGFYEKDRDRYSVDFIYWYNGSGMVEFQMERDSRRVSLRRFQRDLADETRNMKLK
jgi:Meiotically Up-regulated Gene 113 (MUG113) protein